MPFCFGLFGPKRPNKCGFTAESSSKPALWISYSSLFLWSLHRYAGKINYAYLIIFFKLLIYQGSISIVLLDGYFMPLLASFFNYDRTSFTITNYIAGICVYFDVY